MTAISPSPGHGPVTPGHDPAGAPAAHRCGNCDSALTGPYCAQCGQHAHASARNLAAVMHDAWHDLTHVDGRLWHTLWLLLIRPGQLTADYFQERRARYLPPVRLYIVLSAVFFGLNINTVRSHTSAEAHPAPATSTAPAAKAGPDAAGSSTAPPAPSPAGAQGAPAPATPKIEAKPEAKPDADADDDDDADVVSQIKQARDSKGAPLTCDSITSNFSSLQEGIRASCRQMIRDNGNSFVRTLTHNIPKMMFFFLPMVAATMLLLYWRPRRYYVEHLIFLLHNHSALFLGFLVIDAIALLTRLVHSAHVLVPVAGVAMFFYAPWYPYRAMRRYYGQGRLLTTAKYLALVTAYLVCLVITLVGTAIYTALEG